MGYNVEFLESLKNLGLPSWFVIAAAAVFILHQIGALRWFDEIFRDRQEFSQQQASETRKFEQLQESWRDDRLAAILEENESFIRERVWDKLEQIHSQIRRAEMTIAQVRDVLSLLSREVAEIVDKHKTGDD